MCRDTGTVTAQADSKTWALDLRTSKDGAALVWALMIHTLGSASKNCKGNDMLMTVVESQGVRVVAAFNGTYAETPTMPAEKAHKVYNMLAGLQDHRLAVIRLTTLRVYQVCND